MITEITPLIQLMQQQMEEMWCEGQQERQMTTKQMAKMECEHDREQELHCQQMESREELHHQEMKSWEELHHQLMEAPIKQLATPGSPAQCCISSKHPQLHSIRPYIRI